MFNKLIGRIVSWFLSAETLKFVALLERESTIVESKWGNSYGATVYDDSGQKLCTIDGWEGTDGKKVIRLEVVDDSAVEPTYVHLDEGTTFLYHAIVTRYERDKKKTDKEYNERKRKEYSALINSIKLPGE